MSRLTDLIAQARTKDPDLARELEREFKVLSSRRAFGLNFERHRPELVELPGRPARKGDKVHILPKRGSSTKADQRLWRVIDLVVSGESHQAQLELMNAAGMQSQSVPIEDIVVIAEFRDHIYPGLVSTGKVERSADKPYHTVINGENYHALEALTYTHRGRIDTIYIDPPYNTGAKDWKYNNDYVEGDDLYRHSKWLAMMERRLLIAKELLNPDDSVLIVTIDEKEYLRLGLLLEQVFPEGEIQMVTSVIAPQGSARGRLFKRSEEYIFCVFFGKASVTPLPLGAEWGGTSTATVRGSIHWASLKRTGTGARRFDREGMFYPVFLTEDCLKFSSVGEPIGSGVNRDTFEVPEGSVAIWPIRRDGSEGRWQVGPGALRSLIQKGYARLGKPNSGETAIAYLKAGEQRKVGKDYEIVGHRDDGSIITNDEGTTEAAFRPTTVWSLSQHSAGHHGSNLLRTLIPGRAFPFPKSLYVVEDTLRFFVAQKPNAVILDFFSGSGTTAHAVMRLNRQDGGHRQSISITNNEVAAEEQKILHEKGIRPGDAEWEKLGICDFITKPRIEAAITGKTQDGSDIHGVYKFTDVFSMADGFEENAEFFTLTYESPITVSHNHAFARIAPLLWLRAGSTGRRVDDLPERGWDVADTYGLLIDLDQAKLFIDALANGEKIRLAYIVTDNDRLFQAVAQQLPASVEPVRLYESYLQNFRITMGR